MIIIDIVDVKAVLPNIAKEVEYADFKTYLENAEFWIRKNIFGDELFALLDDNHADDKDLEKLTKNVIVLKAYSIGIPYMDLIQTANGFGVIKDSKRAPASKERVNRLIAANLTRLSLETEQLITYLEDNPVYHKIWKPTPAYALLTDCIFTTVKEYKRFATFVGNRNDFLLIHPLLLNESSVFIAPIISKNYLNELIAKQNETSLSTHDKYVLPIIKSALAAKVTLKNDKIANQLLADVVTIMENAIDEYHAYSISSERSLNAEKGFVNTLDNSTFIFNGGI